MKRKKQPDIRLPKVTILPSGSAFTRVVVNGERISITKPTEEECIAEYVALKYGAKEAKKQPKAKKKTLDEAVTEYINSRREFRSPSTIYGYESYKKNAFQSMMKSDVYTTTDLQWQAAIRKEMKAGHSPKYIKNAWMLMSAAIYEVTRRRPEVMLPEKEVNEKPYLEPDQIDTFVTAIKGQGQIEIAALMELSSLRRSEMLAVKPEHLDFQKATIAVQGAKVAGEKGKLVHKKQNKNDTSRRTVPMIPPLRTALENADLSGEYVIDLTGGWICTRINEICRENGLPEVGNHGLRHSFASLAYHLQIPEKIAMEIGGWKDAGTMHGIYTHLAQKDIAKRSQDFSNYFNPKDETAQNGNENGNEK